MFSRLRNSWALMQEAAAVLRQDRALIAFPILSGICSLLVTATFVIPVLLTLPWDQIARGAQRVQLGWQHAAFSFLFYLVTYFVVVFFNTGLVACVRMRFQGETPTVGDGLGFASRNVGKIFQWSLVAATVGTVLRWLQDRAGWLGRLVISLIGLAWTLAITFVVPVLVYDQVGPFTALRRSVEAFRRTWGETVAANLGMGAAFGLLTLPGWLVLIGAAALGVATVGVNAVLAAGLFGGGLVLAVLYFIGLAIVQSTLQGIFLTACYEYAISGEVPVCFSRDYVVSAWTPKKR
jgi:hypothetical protein